MQARDQDVKGEDVELKALLDDAAEVMQWLYIAETDRFVIMPRGGKPFMAKDKHGDLPLTLQQVRRHLKQELAIAVFASSQGSKFICFDVDDGNEQTVRSVLDSIERFGIDREYAHVSFSGQKGYHIEVFFDELIEIDRLRALYRWVITDAKVDPKQVEFRPSAKQAIKLPFSRHYKTGKMCWFVDRDTLRPIETHDPLFEIRQWPRDNLYALLWQRIAPSPMDVGSTPKGSDERERGCILTLGLNTPLKGKGTRHNTMIRMAVRCRYAGLNQEEMTAVLCEWFELQDKQLFKSTDAEVRYDIAAIVRWVFRPDFVCLKMKPAATVMVSRVDMDWIMRQPSSSRRKLLFLILVFDRANCQRNSKEQLAKMIGADSSTVRRILRTLKNNGCIMVSEGHRKRLATGFYQHPNAYFVTRVEENLPGATGMARGQVEINIMDLADGMNAAYYGAIDKLYRPREMLRIFGKQENTEYFEWLDDHRGGDEHA